MSKEFLLINYKIQFDDEFTAYNELRKKFDALGDKAYDEFEVAYKNNFTNMDEVHEKCLDLGYSCISKYLDEAVAILISNDLMHIDKNSFVENYYKEYLTWEEDFDEVDSRYREIVFSSEQEKEYREQRKDSRGRWVGGGFGMSAAIKGSMEAGAMNMASGMAHSVFNSIANKMTDAITNDEKEELFKDENVLLDLAVAIYSNVSSIQYALADALRDNNKAMGLYVTDEASQKASALVNNLKTGLIPLEKEEMLVNQIIHNDPYDEEVYLFLMKKYGDKNKGIEEICKFLNININDRKGEILEDYYKGLPKDTEEKTLESLSAFKEFADKISISDIKTYLTKFDELLKQHDINIRTVDGILFDTREESAVASKEYAEITAICNRTNFKSEKSVLSAIDETKVYATVIKDKYLEALNKKLIEAIRYEDQVYLDNNFPVNTVDTEEDADKLIAGLESITLRNSDLLEKRLSEVKEKRRLIIEAKDKAAIDKYFSTVVILNDQDVQREIATIRNFNIRTTKLKDERISYITTNAEKIMKKHNDYMERALKYEVRLNTVKVDKKPEKKGVFGFISKAIEKSSELIDGVQEKREKEGWDFITNNGTRTVDSIKNRR